MITVIGRGDEVIKCGGELIRKGEVVAFPTETVYGLGGDALSASAVDKIYAAKGRPSDNPLIAHLADWEDIYKIGVVPASARLLYKAFCPGPLTMVIPKLPIVPMRTTGGRDTVAVRFPSHEVARQLIREAGVPIAAPSANISKHVSATTAQHVYNDLAGRIPLIIDGGSCSVGIESTIVDLTGERPVILRPGIITKEQIEAVLGQVNNYIGVGEAIAPGMKYTHYAPSCGSYLCARSNLALACDQLSARGEKPVVVACADACRLLQGRAHISLGDTAASAVAAIYSALREAESGYSVILIEDFGFDKGYLAFMNRAGKATGGKKYESDVYMQR